MDDRELMAERDDEPAYRQPEDINAWHPSAIPSDLVP
jgi:hypothetical protein